MDLPLMRPELDAVYAQALYAVPAGRADLGALPPLPCAAGVGGGAVARLMCVGHEETSAFEARADATLFEVEQSHHCKAGDKRWRAPPLAKFSIDEAQRRAQRCDEAIQPPHRD